MVNFALLTTGIVVVLGNAPTSFAVKETLPVFPLTLWTGAPLAVIYFASLVKSETFLGNSDFKA